MISLCRCCRTCICDAAAAARSCVVANVTAITRAHISEARGVLASLTPLPLPLPRRVAFFALVPSSLKSSRQGIPPRKLLSTFRAVWGLQICGWFQHHRPSSAPRRTADIVVEKLARIAQICGTAAAARPYGVAALLSSRRFALPLRRCAWSSLVPLH